MRKKTFKDTLDKHGLSVVDFLDLLDGWGALSFSDRKCLIMDEVMSFQKRKIGGNNYE